MKKPSRLIQSIEDSKFYDENQSVYNRNEENFQNSVADPSSARFDHQVSIDAENSFWAAVQGNQLDDSLVGGADTHMNI